TTGKETYRTVILSAAKDLSAVWPEILRCAQDDRARAQDDSRAGVHTYGKEVYRSKNLSCAEFGYHIEQDVSTLCHLFKVRPFYNSMCAVSAGANDHRRYARGREESRIHPAGGTDNR